MTTLKLSTPISFGSETISELIFQPLKAKHLRKMPNDVNADYLLTLAGTLTGVVPLVIDELCAEDAFRVIEVTSGFFPNSRTTGKVP